MLVSVGEVIDAKIRNAKGTSWGMIVKTEGRMVFVCICVFAKDVYLPGLVFRGGYNRTKT